MEFEKGKELSPRLFAKTVPRRWTESEIKYMLQLKKEGKSLKEIGEILDRSIPSIQMKLKRVKKKDGSYNQEHYAEKNKINSRYVTFLNPKTILDLYSGNGNCAYEGYDVTTNDINGEFDCDYNLDALKCLTKLYAEDKKFDLIDLDPFGSAYDCLDLAIKMARKGLCVTLGEMGHKQWKRLDYVKYRYGINNLEDFISPNLIKKIQEIGRCNKKNLIIFDYKNWRNISRVWFIIKPYKEISQWDNSFKV